MLNALVRFARDDPNVDENTRLRNRIAELESLVRELRGMSRTFLTLKHELISRLQENHILVGLSLTSAMVMQPRNGIRDLHDVHKHSSPDKDASSRRTEPKSTEPMVLLLLKSNKTPLKDTFIVSHNHLLH